MSKVFLKDFYIVNATGAIIATSWQVSTISDFSIINSESIFDRNNILEWDIDLTHYANGKILDLDNIDIFIRVKIYTMDMGVTHESDWFEAELVNPTSDEKDITYDGNVISRIKVNEDGTYVTLY